MHITKMHGAGNDFIIIDNFAHKFSFDELSALARRLCTQHTSVGADGLMAVAEPTRGGDYSMLFFNSDGSAGEMCGNGARCIARYGHDHGLAGDVQRVDTVSGTVIGERMDYNLYRVRLNDPSVIDLHRPVRVDGIEYDCSYVELGCPGLPHTVLIMPDYDSIPRAELAALGAALRHAEEFPKGANVSFVKPLGGKRVQAVTYERGVEDFTLACGTGCGALTTALTLRGVLSGEAEISMPGGTLHVSLKAEGGTVSDIRLTGPAVTVFEGELADM